MVIILKHKSRGQMLILFCALLLLAQIYIGSLYRNPVFRFPQI